MKAFLVLLLCSTAICANPFPGRAQARGIGPDRNAVPQNKQKMKVEIWSDIMCPFCYIGKRRFETAMKAFGPASGIEVEWRSFQLDPSIKAGEEKDLYAYLAKRKGISYEQAAGMHQQVVEMAAAEGLDYHFERAVVANSFDAHRLIQLAKRMGLGDAAEERLFKAYFEEGKDFGDHLVLQELAADIGMDAMRVREWLSSNGGADAVAADIAEAGQLGLTGVPFFVFDRKYGVSGAQSSEVFLKTLERAYGEWQAAQPVSSLEVAEGPSCTPQGDCQ